MLLIDTKQVIPELSLTFIGENVEICGSSQDRLDISKICGFINISLLTIFMSIEVYQDSII